MTAANVQPGGGVPSVPADVEAAIAFARAAERGFSTAVAAMADANPAAVTRMLTAHQQRERCLMKLGAALLAALDQHHSLRVSLEPDNGQDGLRATAIDEPDALPEPPAQPVETERVPARAEPSREQTIEVPEAGLPEHPHPTSPPPALATLEELQALEQRFGSGTRSTPEAPAQMGVPLRTLAEQWGTPKQKSEQDCAVVVPRLREAGERLDTWLEHPQASQRLLLAYAVARTRHIQQAIGTKKGKALDPVFRRLTSFSAVQRPGFVHGLARDHRPLHGSWAEDAQGTWAELGLEHEGKSRASRSFTMGELIGALEEGIDDKQLIEGVIRMVDHPEVDQGHLEQILEPHIAHLKGHKKIKRLRKRIVKTIKSKQRSIKSPDPEGPPTDWGWWEYTRGKRCAVVGGDNRNGARRKLRDAFELESLTWESGWDHRRVASLVESIQAGNIDLVLLIRRFIKHKVSEVVIPACKEAGVIFVPVANGYGTRSIQGEIERHLRSAGGEE